MSMRIFHVAQTFLSAVPQVFQPAGRCGNSSGCLPTDALPTGKSAERHVGKPALRMAEPLMSLQGGRPDGKGLKKGLNIQYPTRNVQYPSGESVEDQSRFAEQAVFPSSLEIPCWILDIFPFSHSSFPLPPLLQELLNRFPPLEIGHSLLDIGYFPIPHSSFAARVGAPMQKPKPS